jgi:hypothetical protein
VTSHGYSQPMTVLSRGARSRRGRRRPGWALLTALLGVATAAGLAALVFTSRTQLLKLAVVLALWAAIMAAFASVWYRRQSDVDQAKARDLKLVYDLQLDREIAARREYELEVETQLRRELADELQAQAADEVAALRAELATLRANLEILFDTDLAHRPAIETERTTVRAYSDWARDTEHTDPSRVTPRFTASAREGVAYEEDHIIDVPEEPPEPEGEYPQPPATGEGEPPPRQESWRATTEQAFGTRAAPHSTPEPAFHPEPQRPEPQRPEPQRPEPQPEEWQPVAAEGQWLPPGSAGSNWLSSGNGFSAPGADIPWAPEPTPVAAEARRGRHSSGAEPTGAAPAPPAPPPPAPPPPAPPPPAPPPPPPAPPRQPEYGTRRARHSAESGLLEESDVTRETLPTPPAPAQPEPATRDRAEEPAGGQHGEGQGQSVAELLARLQHAGQSEGGRRRRRDD